MDHEDQIDNQYHRQWTRRSSEVKERAPLVNEDDKDSLLDSESECEMDFDLSVDQAWAPRFYNGFESNKFSDCPDDVSNNSMMHAYESASQLSISTPTLIQDYSNVDLKERLLPTFGGH